MLSNVLQNYMTILYNFGNQNLINLSIKDNNPLKYHPYNYSSCSGSIFIETAVWHSY